MVFNLQRSMAATSAAGASTKKECAKYVRQYIEAGGISTAGRPGYAWAYRNYLPSIGWQHFTTLTGLAQQLQFTKTMVRPGDIAVMNHGQYGHICMWNGRCWVSDFVQRNMWVYPGQGTCYIFRYTGKITNQPFNPNIQVNQPPPPFPYEKLVKPTEDLVAALTSFNNPIDALISETKTERI